MNKTNDESNQPVRTMYVFRFDGIPLCIPLEEKHLNIELIRELVKDYPTAYAIQFFNYYPHASVTNILRKDFSDIVYIGEVYTILEIKRMRTDEEKDIPEFVNAMRKLKALKAIRNGGGYWTILNDRKKYINVR